MRARARPAAPAGPTPERQRPVGDAGRHEPPTPDTIIDAELQRALEDPGPLRGIAQLTARLAAAFVLDPAGVTRTKALGSERMARKLRDALPGGDAAMRSAIWELVRPMLSPALTELNRDAFVTEDRTETTVDLQRHRAASDLDELALDDDQGRRRVAEAFHLDRPPARPPGRGGGDRRQSDYILSFDRRSIQQRPARACPPASALSGLRAVGRPRG